MLRDIGFRTPLDVLCRALLGNPPTRKKPVAVRLHSDVRVVRAKPHLNVIACREVRQSVAPTAAR